MEQWSVAHRSLQLFCADFWSTPEDCQSILDEIGVSSGRINLSEPSIMRWMSIIRELMRKNDGSMATLAVVLQKQYPANKGLAAVCAPWTPSQPAKTMEGAQGQVPAAGDPVTTPSPLAASVPEGAVLVKKFEEKPGPVPVLAPPDFAEEAGLVVPRIETLWAAMIDVERRLLEAERKLPQTDKPS